MKQHLFTSESVTEGHPDKLADQISDAILDAMLKQDPLSRVAVECLTTTGLLVVAGEVTTRASVDIQKVVRGVVKRIGYDNPTYGFDCDGCSVLVSLHEQSPDIAMGVDEHENKEQGAGDQGMMAGYAVNETSELMPLPISLAHKLTLRLSEARKKGELKWLRPDGKSQVTVEYEDGKPKRVHTVVVSAQHDPDIPLEDLRKEIKEKIIVPVCGTWLDGKTICHINPTGRFVIGGPPGDTGLTGRKIIVDTYGGQGAHGGGAFCVAGDSLVNTEDGLVHIKNLEKANGKCVKTDISPMPVETWFSNGRLPTLRINTVDGFSLEGTPNQCIRVLDEDGNYVWRQLDQLKKTDWVAIQRKNRLFGRQAATSGFIFEHNPSTHRKNTFNFPLELTEDYGYLLGLLTGDGRCAFKDGIAICVCEEETKKNIQTLYTRLFGRPGKIFGHWAFFGGLELRAFLEHLGLGKWRSWEKRVPASVFLAPAPVVAAFLRGLFDTDGTIRRTGRFFNSPDIKLTSTSRALIDDVQLLLLNFGIGSRVQVVMATGKTSVIKGRTVTSRRPLYHLRVRGAESALIFRQKIGFGLQRKAAKLAGIDLADKRDLRIVPAQRARIRRLWNRLPSPEKQRDPFNIGRLARHAGSKATKELTYEKLREFLDGYAARFEGDLDFEHLRMLYVMNHNYTRATAIVPSVADVYDLVVPGAHTFTANGFICHNSGKDPSKVDRSGAYMARYIAKNVVAAGLADRCLIQIAYAIGVAAPVSVMVNTFGTHKIPEERIEELIKKHFDLRPRQIIDYLQLRRPIFEKTAAYGHFGREEPEFTWERTDKAEELRKEGLGV